MELCERFWRDFDGEPSAALRAHAEECPGCRAMLEALTASEERPEPVPAGLADLARAELAAHPRARPWWVGVLLLGAVSAASLVAVARPAPGWVMAPAFGALGLPLAVVLAAAFGSAMVAAIAPRRGVGVFGAIAGIAVAVGALLAACHSGGTFQARGGGLPCAVVEVLVSALPLAVAVILLRGFDFSWRRTVAGVAAAGGVGVLLLELTCANPTRTHVFSSHVLPWLVTCAVAIVIRRGLRSGSYAP